MSDPTQHSSYEAPQSSPLLDLIHRMRAEIRKVIIGQDTVIDQVLASLLAGGHVLLEGKPGLGKTHLVNTLAKSFGGHSGRIQFTPDLMPSDVTGFRMFDMRSQTFQLRRGPVFTNLLLADEINRAPAKTQAALLEVMQEVQVTIDGETLRLEPPFMTLATQNPVEHEGTYPLPEAQLDRFLMHVQVGYPAADAEARILHLVREQARDGMAGRTAPDRPRITQAMILAARRAVLDLHFAPALEDYLVQLVLASRDARGYDAELARRIAWGASPRGSIALERCARARAWLEGRDYVTPEDLHAVAPDVLRHRVLPSFEAVAAGITADTLVQQLLQRVPLP